MGKVVYHQELRAIGQALEAQNISTFELKNQSGRYLVTGSPDRPNSLSAAFRQWRNGNWRRGTRSITYTTQMVTALEQKGRTQRAAPGRLPEFYNVSNILRTVGTYLDMKSASLVEIQKRALTITLLYHISGGHPQVEDRTIASFYKTFIEMHGKRSRTDKS
ncbi:MAG: hypothetical protein OEN50_12525 [Deltaproteobacteria bacterium]|nr:hypothetical protein [Deltaproteobacteria bacterium]